VTRAVPRKHDAERGHLLAEQRRHQLPDLSRTVAVTRTGLPVALTVAPATKTVTTVSPSASSPSTGGDSTARWFQLSALLSHTDALVAV
jgi:hypothetical protein